MKRFSRQEINNLEHLYKINLINSCSGYKSANLIATVSNEGKTNVSVFSSVVHIGSAPPLFGIVFRPLTVPRNTYDNIKETGMFTINHIHKSILKEAHHTSAKYPKAISEFDATTLEPYYRNESSIPFVKGCPVAMLMEYREEYHIKANNTIMLIAEVKELYANEELIEEDGFINLSKAEVAAINSLDGYVVPEKPKRQSYQRPKKEFLEQLK